MNTTTILLISILLVALPVIPAYLLNFPAYLVSSGIGFALVIFLLIYNKTWTTLRSRIVGLYFSGIYALGIALGVFLALPSKPKLFAIAGLIFILPFIFQFVISIKPFIAKIFSRRLLEYSNGYVAFLLVLIIGAVIGRYLTNFYELLVLYTGTVLVAILTLLYFRK